MIEPDRAAIWRCLVGYGVDPAQATHLVARSREASLRWAFDAADELEATTLPRAARPRSTVRVEIDPYATASTDPSATLRRLDLLAMPQRRAVLAHHVGGIPADRLGSQAGVDRTDLESAEAVLAVGLGASPSSDPVAALVSPIAELEPPDELLRSPLAVGPVVAVTGVIVVVLFALAVARGRPAPAESAAVVVDIPATTAPSITTTVAPSTTTELVFVEPDREVEVEVTEANTLMRREPWTRRIIWESRPFRSDVEIVSVDPNTVTLNYGGERLLINLADGTFLPP